MVVKQTIYITSNPDLSPIESYWVTGSMVAELYDIIGLKITPEIAVNITPSEFEIHFDCDNTMQWQFKLRVKERNINIRWALQFTIDLLYDSAKGTKAGIIKKLMEETYFQIPKDFDENNVEMVITTFIKYLLNTLRNRVIV